MVETLAKPDSNIQKKEFDLKEPIKSTRETVQQEQQQAYPVVNWKDVLQGTWSNELGSQVKLKVDGDKLTGTYTTGVGNAKTGQISGLFVPQENGCLISWTVPWTKLIDPSKPDAICTWNGFLINNGKWQIVSTWLLNSWLPQDDLWEATIINKDTFSKQ